jgi:hypothetical protein
MFTFDYRNTRSPYIGNGYIDIYFLGELTEDLTRNQCVMEPDYMDFINSATFSQLVVSESAASCFMNTWAGSDIGRFELDEERINLLFETNDLKFNTTAIGTQIPLF